MHESVQRGSNPLDGDGVFEADPAEEESHGVVVEVQEAKRGLAQYDENSVEQLIELGQEEDIEPEIERALACRFAFRIAKEAFNSIALGW